MIVVGTVVATDVMEFAIGVVPVEPGVVDVGALLLPELVVIGVDVVGDAVVGTAVTDGG